MYIYDKYDRQLIRERVSQFRDQTIRYREGKLSEEQFLPLRLQNGLYIQRQAPMLRIAVPYGMLSSKQLRKLAHICREYDKGYCHVTTRQNIQLNWPKLDSVPDILSELSEVEMHAIQTSGNCIRNVTSDQFAGVAEDELIDPRPYCEMVRQWSTLHPEFAFLPRKFKIAISGAKSDRAATRFHDIGLRLKQNETGNNGFEVIVGGGLGRTPVIGTTIKEFLPEEYLLSYLCSILRIYNQYGRRDNKYKARIKILLRERGAAAFITEVEEEWLRIKDNYSRLSNQDIDHAKSFFSAPKYQRFDEGQVQEKLDLDAVHSPEFARWMQRSVSPHRVSGYSAVTLSLKNTGAAPGDISDVQLEGIADLADRYSFGEVRTTHQQNVVLADVRKIDLFGLWARLRLYQLKAANIGTVKDIVCCPGGDFCSLANAKSIPVADAIQRTFNDMDYVYDLGEIKLNISGCMNACAHHHVGHIGILGVDKKGEEFYQVTLGGNNGTQGRQAKIGEVLGPAFSQQEIPRVIEKILKIYVELRFESECFVDAVSRLGVKSFKERVYA